MKTGISTAILALALLAGCKSEEKASGKIEDVIEARATVTAVNLPQRQLTLKEEDGSEVVVSAGPAVKNLDQVRVGDTVAVSFTAAVAWQVKSGEKGATGVTSASAVQAAKPGEKPAGSVGHSVMLTVAITAIDTAAGTVTLTGPAGKSLTLKPRDAQNLEKMKVGDLVDITYSETVAVSVQLIEKKK